MTKSQKKSQPIFRSFTAGVVTEQKSKSKRLATSEAVVHAETPQTQSLPCAGIPAMATEPTIKPTSKQDSIVALLRREHGASLSELMAATGWQKHSVRGVISGGLKKKLRLHVLSTSEVDRGRTYRIVSSNIAEVDA